jgi:excisionase family DNA binding protein
MAAMTASSRQVRPAQGASTAASSDASPTAADHGVDVPDRLLTVEEAAPILGLGRSTLYRLVAEGGVPHRRTLVGVIKFAPADIHKIFNDAHRPPVKRRQRRLNVAG